MVQRGLHCGDFVHEDDLEIEGGALNCYSASGDSDGIIHRYFCSQCGASIAVKPEVFEGVKAIKASSLDDNFLRANDYGHFYLKQTTLD